MYEHCQTIVSVYFGRKAYLTSYARWRKAYLLAALWTQRTTRRQKRVQQTLHLQEQCSRQIQIYQYTTTLSPQASRRNMEKLQTEHQSSRKVLHVHQRTTQEVAPQHQLSQPSSQTQSPRAEKKDRCASDGKTGNREISITMVIPIKDGMCAGALRNGTSLVRA